MEAVTRPSKKQRELLSFIDGFIRGHGYGPSYREIMRALDYRSVSTVAVHVDGLIKKGHLQKRDHSARSLVVVGTSDAPVRPVPFAAPAKADEKWLVDRVMARFDDYDREPTQQRYDELCILTGAMSVLGLEAAAMACKARLSTLQGRAN